MKKILTLCTVTTLLLGILPMLSTAQEAEGLAHTALQELETDITDFETLLDLLDEESDLPHHGFTSVLSDAKEDFADAEQAFAIDRFSDTLREVAAAERDLEILQENLDIFDNTETENQFPRTTTAPISIAATLSLDDTFDEQQKRTLLIELIDILTQLTVRS